MRDVDFARIGERIRKLRKERGWTLDQLAQKAGVTKGFLSRVENQKTGIGAVVLFRIARALDVSTDRLLEGVQ